MQATGFQATGFEYRFRFAIHAVIYMLGFWSSYWVTFVGVTNKSTWLVLSSVLARNGWLSFGAAVDTLLVLMLVFAALGAGMRTWGTAYVGSGVVASGAMHGAAMLADGPFRRTRNPLYLGTLLHTFAIAVLMTPLGALMTVVLLWVFQIRLALAEEPFLAARFGQPYLAYKAVVPRFLPSLTPLVPAAGRAPRWGQAVLGELYFILAVFVLGIFGWSFNATPLMQGLLISLGIWLVVRGAMPRAAVEPTATAG